MLLKQILLDAMEAFLSSAMKKKIRKYICACMKATSPHPTSIKIGHSYHFYIKLRKTEKSHVLMMPFTKLEAEHNVSSIKQIT